MTSEKAVAVHRVSGGLPTTDAPVRSDLGPSQRTGRHRERIDPANPSGPVDALLGVRAAASLDVTDLRDPLELDGRGDGVGIS